MSIRADTCPYKSWRISQINITCKSLSLQLLTKLRPNSCWDIGRCWNFVVFEVEAVALSVSPFRWDVNKCHVLDEQAYVFALIAVTVTGMSVALQEDGSNSDAGEKFSSEYLHKKAYSECIQKFQHHIQPKYFVLRIGENFTDIFVSWHLRLTGMNLIWCFLVVLSLHGPEERCVQWL